ncbi:hypothetical protein B296_00029704 [Ensete ventricosum]|uniref:Uncharacterized protein n=1 Tax=Ensete ventricosum TaxID=4639 RepID=A0A426ZGK0_ENSVE|nr:hypothetical protein B296_00029704 [Ensete ventricosum]
MGAPQGWTATMTGLLKYQEISARRGDRVPDRFGRNKVTKRRLISKDLKVEDGEAIANVSLRNHRNGISQRFGDTFRLNVDVW